MLQRLRTLLLERRTLASVLRNSGWLILERAFRAVTGLAVGIWVARYLGPDQFGHLSLALAVFAVMAPIVTFGLDAIVVREIARTPSRSHVLLGTSVVIKITGAFLAMSIASAAVLNFPGLESGSRTLILVVCIGLFGLPAHVIDWWFQANLRSRMGVGARIAALALSAMAKVALVLCHAPLLAFALVYALESFAMAVAFVLAYRRFPTQLRWTFDRVTAKHLLRDAWPMFLSSLVTVAYLRVDQFMLASMAGNSEVGVYAAVLPLVEGLFVIPVALTASAAPVLARLYAESAAAFDRRMEQFLRYIACMGLAASTALSLFAEPLVRLLLGPGYAASSAVLAILAWVPLLVFVGVAENQWIVVRNRRGLRVLKTFVGAITSLAMNLMLVPSLGAIGTAVAAVTAHVCAVVVVNVFVARELLRLQLRAFGLYTR